jgi:Cytochrome c554 and c-prime
MRRVSSALVFAAGAFLALVVSIWPRSAVLGVPATDERPSLPHKFAGIASCAALACHHGNGPRGSRGSEYTTWAIYDPHAKAYEALLTERSRGIQDRLNQYEPTNRRVKAEDNALCLKCHATPAGKLPLPSGERAGVRGEAPETNLPPPTPLSSGARGKDRAVSHELIYGVSCESCHGPAEKWRAEHYSPNWKVRTDKEALGFRNTKDLAVRAAICAECHVGSPDREVNHDLIAAGHPRLQFEFAAYLANYPKHWNTDDDKRRHPDHEARAWVIGQIVSSAAALRLLEARAEKSKVQGPKSKVDFGHGTLDFGPSAPWPELAEYDCFACHHDLAPDGWRQKASYLKQRSKPGSLLPSAWYTSMPPILGSRLTASMKLPLVPLPLGDLRKAMTGTAPDTARVAELARETANQLEQWLPALAKGEIEPTTIKDFLENLEELSPGGQALGSWDEAVQRYLMARAINEGLKDRDASYENPALERRLHRVSRWLEFSPNYDSPRSFNPFALPAPKSRGD